MVINKLLFVGISCLFFSFITLGQDTLSSKNMELHLQNGFEGDTVTIWLQNTLILKNKVISTIPEAGVAAIIQIKPQEDGTYNIKNNLGEKDLEVNIQKLPPYPNLYIMVNKKQHHYQLDINAYSYWGVYKYKNTQNIAVRGSARQFAYY